MKPLVIDVETTIFQKGNPYAERNKLCVVGDYDGSTTGYYQIDCSGLPYGKTLEAIRGRIRLADLIIFFNAKFDISWLRRYKINVEDKDIWDVQYAHFCIIGQESKFPSLNEVLAYYGLPLKKDVVKEEYWDKKIDTPDIPPEILEEYTIHDCISEYKAFECQREYLKDKPQLKRLIWTGCKDLKVTQEMEWNGLKLDVNRSLTMGDEYLEQIRGLDAELFKLVPWDFINWNSGYHLSAILYGGVLRYKSRQSYEKTLKDGRVVEKSHEVTIDHVCPQLVEPLKGSKLAKEGYYSTDEGTLKSLKSYGIAKKIIDLILQRAKLEKKVGTYFHGFPKLYKEMDWTNNILHGQLNHCVAATGRLSSSKPNQQNMEEDIRKCIVTRFQRDLNE